MDYFTEKFGLSFVSAEDLADVRLWISVLKEFERCLGAKLTNLDNRDPVRRVVEDLENAAKFICAYEPQDSYRMLHGKFAAKKVRSQVCIDISLFRGEGTFPCSVDLYFPQGSLLPDTGLETVLAVFDAGIKHLKPFYAYGDLGSQVYGKCRADGSAVDLESELIGMFWLTYLHSRYVEFFGRKKMDRVSGVDTDSRVQGATFRLGTFPGTEESIIARRDAEAILGVDAFVDPTRVYGKLKGKYALTYEQLRD